MMGGVSSNPDGQQKGAVPVVNYTMEIRVVPRRLALRYQYVLPE